MEENTPTPLPAISPVLKALSHLIIVLGLYFIFGIVFSLIGGFIAELLTGVAVKQDIQGMVADLADPTKVTGYKIYIAFASLGSFVVTAVVFARVFAKERPAAYFGFHGIFPPAKIMGLVIVMALSALPVLSYLAEISTGIQLPDEVAKEANALQESNNAIYGAFLQGTGLGVLLLNLLVMAVIPALGEELLFRGTMLQLFYRLFGQRIHIAIFTTAFLFSVVHLQAYNFIAICLIGVMFGYLYYWSGNIMVSVWAHFLNNGIVVFAAWLYNQYPQNTYLSPEYDFGLVPALAGAAIFAGAMYLFYKTTRPYHAES